MSNVRERLTQPKPHDSKSPRGAQTVSSEKDSVPARSKHTSNLSAKKAPPTLWRVLGTPRCLVAALFVVFALFGIGYLIVVLEGKITLGSRRKGHAMTQPSGEEFEHPRLSVASVFSGCDIVSMLQEKDARGSSVSTVALPLLGAMLTHRLEQAQDGRGASEKGVATIPDSTIKPPCRGRDGLVVGALAAAIEKLIHTYEQEDAEDDVLIKAHTFGPVPLAARDDATPSSASPNNGETSPVRFAGRLPSDVFLFGEFLWWLLTQTETQSGTEAIVPPVLAGYAWSQVLPRYFLLIDDRRRHTASLFAAADSLNGLSHTMTGPLAVAASTPRSKEGKKAATDPSPAPSGTGTVLSTSEGLDMELARLRRRLTVTAPEDWMVQLREKSAAMATAFATGSPTCVSTSSQEQDRNDNHTDYSTARCAAHFASLAAPAGLPSKVGSLLEEAVVLHPSSVPVRLVYAAHVVLSMRRCDDSVQEHLARELKGARVRIAADGPLRQWFRVLEAVCARSVGGVAQAGYAARDGIAEQLPLRTTSAIAGDWSAIGLAPNRPVISDAQLAFLLGE